MAVRGQDLKTWATHLLRKEKCSDGCGHDFWLIPAKFISLRYINYPRFVSGELVNSPYNLSKSCSFIVSSDEKAIGTGACRGMVGLQLEQ